MTSGILVALLIICTLLAFITGACAAMFAIGAIAHRDEADEQAVEEQGELREQWANFLSYDGKNQENLR